MSGEKRELALQEVSFLAKEASCETKLRSALFQPPVPRPLAEWGRLGDEITKCTFLAPLSRPPAGWGRLTMGPIGLEMIIKGFCVFVVTGVVSDALQQLFA